MLDFGRWLSTKEVEKSAASNDRFGVELRVKELNDHGFDINDTMALFRAVEAGHMTMVRFLIEEKGADIERMAMGDVSLLHVAAEHDQPEAVRFFLEAGLDPDWVDETGHTPRSIAQERESYRALDEFDRFVDEHLLEKTAPTASTPKTGTPEAL